MRVHSSHDCSGCYHCPHIAEDNKHYLLVTLVNLMCAADCTTLKFTLSRYEYFFLLSVSELRGRKDANGEVVDLVPLTLFEYLPKSTLHAEDVNVKQSYLLH